VPLTIGQLLHEKVVDLGYDRYLTVEISAMVQRAEYDPGEVVTRSFRTVVDAARTANVRLVYRGATVGAS
jgi:hypothetical protein